MFVVGRAEFARFMLQSFLFGTASAAVYLFYGIFRIAFEKLPKAARVALTALFDLSYCLTLAFFGLLLVFKANRGQMRISAALFYAAGFALTVFAFGRPVYRLERKLLSGVYEKIVAPILARARAAGRRCAARVRAMKQKIRKNKAVLSPQDGTAGKTDVARAKERKARAARKDTQREGRKNEKRKPSARAHRDRAVHRSVHRHDH